jgi:Flp pilus assembly protein TadG
MQRLRRQTRSRQGGAAAVEFAIVSMLLFTLLFGIVQYGFYFYSKQAASAAVREAARQAAVGSLACGTGAGQFQGFVKDRVGEADFGSTFTATRTFPADPQVGDTVEVSVSFTSLDLKLPFVPLPTDAIVDETAQSRVENVTENSVNC